jgi:citrate lyase subunit beta/citryl-CoA lyase
MKQAPTRSAVHAFSGFKGTAAGGSVEGKIRRSIIEVPGNVERMLLKARDFPVDVLMLDLEDSVPATDDGKIQARAGIRDLLERGPLVAREVSIRLNPPGSKWFLEDARFAIDVGVTTVVVPKPYSADEVVFAERSLDSLGASEDLRMMVAVETPGALLGIEDFASRCGRIDGIMSGGFDYLLETGSLSLLTPEEFDLSHLDYNRQRVLAAARAYGWTATDGLLVVDPKNPDEARAAALRSRRLGYDGCGLFYPPHIEIVNQVFSPTPAELEWAERIITAYRASEDSGRAALYLDRRAILPQHYKLAHRLVSRAATLES